MERLYVLASIWEARFAHFLAEAFFPMGPVHCSQDPQVPFFSNFFFKTESHDTIYIFKIYFATVFLIFNF